MSDPWTLSVRALLLDVDDTLVDTRSSMLAACAESAAASLPDHPAAVHTAIADDWYADPDGLFDRYAAGELPFETMRELRYRGACRRTGVDDSGVAAYLAAYNTAFERAQRLFDDVIPLLDRARDAGVACVFVTNSSTEHTLMKLRAVGIADRAELVTTDTLGVGKPDPAIFRHALALAGVAADEAVVVGDTLPTDVRGARGAGIRAAWVERPGQTPPRSSGWGTPVDDPCVHVVASLVDVPVG